jgi:hypothetical protein
MSNKNVTITVVQGEKDVRGILALQQKNLKKNLSDETMASQGFVTVEHDFATLKAMNDAQPSVIAKDGDEVVGYCLAMLPQFRKDVPVLESLFASIDQIDYEGKPLNTYHYMVMGQVCVGEGYRGIGVFDKMYQHLKEVLSNDFEICVTDISSKNTRSLRTHERVGFEAVKDFFDENLNETWIIVVWDWRARE